MNKPQRISVERARRGHLAAQRHLSARRRQAAAAGVGPAERLLPGARRLGQHPLQFPEPSRRRDARARHRRRSREGRGRERCVDGEALEDAIHAAGGCAGYVRSEEQWLQPSPGAGGGEPAAARDRAHRRRAAMAADRRARRPLARRPRARPHARARRSHLRQEPRRARRRRAQDQRRAPAGLRHWSSSTPASASAPRYVDLRNNKGVDTLRELVAKARCLRPSPTARARSTARGFSPEDWRGCGPASSARRSARGARAVHGAAAAASTASCRR